MPLMRHASLKMFCALAVAGLSAAVVAGCGNDVPPNAVAKVGDSVITQDEFNKWLKTASAGQAQGGQTAAPDPPDFKKCVAAKKKQPVPKGQDQPTDAQLKKQCQQQFNQLKTEVMQFLIQSEWVQQEAEAQGVKVSNKEIKRSFEEQKKQAFPNAKAEQAKKALENGQSWKQVVKKYSIDEASKAQGGKLPAVSKGQNEKAFDDAIFGARKGEIKGPVKTQFGWYVFEVQKITPASQQSLAESKETIRNLLRSQGQQKALDAFIKDFRENYKDDTECADDYRVAECKNAPKESTETGPASGGAPGGQQPQQPQAPQPEAPSQQNPQQPQQP